jgi:hypothetical protein
MIFSKMAQLNHKPMTTQMKGIIAYERISHSSNIIFDIIFMLNYVKSARKINLRHANLFKAFMLDE